MGIQACWRHNSSITSKDVLNVPERVWKFISKYMKLAQKVLKYSHLIFMLICAMHNFFNKLVSMISNCISLTHINYRRHTVNNFWNTNVPPFWNYQSNLNRFAVSVLNFCEISLKSVSKCGRYVQHNVAALKHRHLEIMQPTFPIYEFKWDFYKS